MSKPILFLSSDFFSRLCATHSCLKDELFWALIPLKLESLGELEQKVMDKKCLCWAKHWGWVTGIEDE